MDDYTAEELQVHYEATIRNRAETMRDWSNVIRVANHAKERSYRKFIKRLEDTGRQLDLAMGRSSTETESFFSALDSFVSKKKSEES